jgi:DNA (cytosine-5)-methyltransferase 1
MKHGSLFSGIGGFDLAAEWMGWENIFHCEWNEFGQRVLKHHFPKSISYADITKVDFRHHRGDIDIISGGFPCQPYSSAGKRLGKEDDRHLWPEMLRCIREVSPRWVVGENVLGLVNWNGGMVFEEVQADLEAQGYEVQPFILPACAVNAPHVRQRVWFVAWNAKGGREADKREVQRGQNTYADRVRGTIQGASINPDKCNDRRAARKDERESGAERIQEWDSIRQSAQSGEVQRNAPDSDHQGLQRSKERRSIKESRKERNQQPARCVSPSWQNFPTKPPICGGDDGLSRELDGITFPKWRNESIKAYGNAIVPQVAHQIFKAIEAYENLEY